MRKIILIMLFFLVAACNSEIKPYLKPAPEADIPTRIANQQKWLTEAIARRELPYGSDASPIQIKLNKIKEKYSKLQSAGTLTDKDSKEINKMLDETSDMVFRLRQKKLKQL